MLDLRDKDLVSGRTYFDRMGSILYLFLAPWLAVFCLAFISYNNKVSGISDQGIPLLWGGLLAGLLLIFCIYFYIDFSKQLKTIPGKAFKEKVKLYYAINKSFYIKINLLGVIATLLYVFFNIGPLIVFNCFIVVVTSLEKPSEERFFRHLRLSKNHIKGFKDRALFEKESEK